MDKSALLQRLIDKEYGGDPLMLLGELQVRGCCILYLVLRVVNKGRHTPSCSETEQHIQDAALRCCPIAIYRKVQRRLADPHSDLTASPAKC